MAKGLIVIKIGSSSLTSKSGHLDKNRLVDHVDAIARLTKEKYQVVMVTSGAVAAGYSSIGYAQRPQTIQQKQASAAVGQSLLMQAYTEAFHRHQCVTAQLLVTRADFQSATRFKHISETVSELLKRRVIPIINENDSTSVDELTFGDNDLLSALVSGMVHADMLCLFTDINGVYDQNPFQHKEAKKYHYINAVTDQLIEEMGESHSNVGTGGMKSKLIAAKTANEFGVSAFIGTGNDLHTFYDILLGKGDGTYVGHFSQKSMSVTKQWILYHSQPVGSVFIDSGASLALLKHRKSLLATGVVSAQGPFRAGDIINVFAGDTLIGRGKITCDSEELMTQITTPTKLKSKKAIINRDFWVTI